MNRHPPSPTCGLSKNLSPYRPAPYRQGLTHCLLLPLTLLCSALQAEDPVWIWSHPPPQPSPTPPQEVVLFRHAFTTPPFTWNARLTVVATHHTEVFLNGKPVAQSSRPDQIARAEVSMHLHQGPNLLAVRSTTPPPTNSNPTPAGILIHLNLGGTERREIASNPEWHTTREPAPDSWNQLHFDASNWGKAHPVDLPNTPSWDVIESRGSATPAESLQLLPGFTAELLRSATPEEGSWVCLAFDPQGRLVLSPEGDHHPLLRLAFDSNGQLATLQPIPAPVRFAMGLLFAHGSLYANALGPSGSGLYRLTDHNGNDQFDPEEVSLLKKFQGGGEHGYHALALGPDQQIYVLNGNMTRPLEDRNPHSPYRHFAEDVLSLNPEETTRASGALVPGGHVLRTDPDGRSWNLVAGGLRNAYDFDFSPTGELFTYDSDNEWDWGTPWYRATRVFHLVSGAEAGWRDGTRAWPDHYPDQVRPVLDPGIGSPCGVKFGTHARFPEKYRRALYLQDWSYGRILAVHLEPHGASFRGTFEPLLSGQPLNLTSMAFGPDGALYFVTGGRGTQSGLYRVRYTGSEPTSTGPLPPTPAEQATAPLRQLRHQLERFHGAPHPDAVPFLWPHLGHPDPAIRFAARVALEAQPPEDWHPRALAETQPTVALHALLALARTGPPDTQPALLRTLARFPLADLDEDHRLLKYRVIQLSFLRQGHPGPDLARLAREKLGVRFPATSWPENRELTRLLAYLEDPDLVPRALDLLDTAPSQEQQLHYVAQIRRVRDGWTPELRERYFRWWLHPRDHLARPTSLLHWMHDVQRTYVDGANLNRHLESFRREALAAIPPDQRTPLQTLAETPLAGAQLIPPQPREFVRNWTMADVLPHLDQADYGRNFDRGRRAFIDTQCYACHRLGNTGGAIGPELTGVRSKYGRRELLEALLEPSKVISEQFQNHRVFLHDGEDHIGRLIRESPDEIVLETDPLSATELTLPRSTVESLEPSPLSPMPEGLLQILTLDDILDLLAFLESAGSPDAPAFRTPDP